MLLLHRLGEQAQWSGSAFGRQQPGQETVRRPRLGCPQEHRRRSMWCIVGGNWLANMRFFHRRAAISNGLPPFSKRTMETKISLMMTSLVLPQLQILLMTAQTSLWGAERSAETAVILHQRSLRGSSCGGVGGQSWRSYWVSARSFMCDARLQNRQDAERSSSSCRTG